MMTERRKYDRREKGTTWNNRCHTRKIPAFFNTRRLMVRMREQGKNAITAEIKGRSKISEDLQGK